MWIDININNICEMSYEFRAVHSHLGMNPIGICPSTPLLVITCDPLTAPAFGRAETNEVVVCFLWPTTTKIWH